MNEEQYSRANKRVLLAIVVVFGYIAATLMLALGVSQGGHAAKIVMEAVTAAAVIVISVVAYLGKRTTRTCAVIMTLSMMIGYFVIVQLNTTVGTWTYGLPLLIVAMVYLDKKIVMVTNGIALVSIVVHLVRCFLGDGSDLQNNVIGLFVLLLTAYACNSAEHLLECFFKENLAEIQNASDIQKDSNKKMIIVAENISKHFGEAMDMLDGLQESINVSHSSIQEIADSTESTAEAIQKQAVMCSDIQGNTDQAEQGIKEMIEASHKTNDNVKEGAGVVSELKEQAVNVADASQVTVDVIRSLTDKVEEPGFVHAKVFVVDDSEAVVGTINLDYRSLYHHFENAVWMKDTACIPAIEKDFQKTLEFCRDVEPTRESIWEGNVLLHLAGILLKVIAPLL